MINQQLLDFIKEQLSKGLTKDAISKELLANGWELKDVEEGFRALTPSAVPTPLIPTNPRTQTYSSNNKIDTKVKETKLFIFLRTFLVFSLSLIFGLYTFLFLLNRGGSNIGYIFLAGPVLIVMMFIPVIPYFFLFRYLFKHDFKHRNIIFTVCFVFIILNICYITFSLQSANKQPSMFPAQLVTNGPLKVGYALQYKITTTPKAYFYKNGNIYLNIELVQPDGVVKKEFVVIDMPCTHFLLTSSCTPQSSYERTFTSAYYNPEMMGHPDTFGKAGNYTLTSDSPEITPVTFQVTN